MWAYTAQRILYAVPIALGVTVVCFALVYLAPGDPVQMLLPPDASQADVEFLKKLYGFDQPIPIQYFKWRMRAATGDLGVSLQTSRPVFDEVARALSNTIIISLGAVMLAFSLAFVLGTIAAYYAGQPMDRIVTGISVVGVSVPNYWLGIVLIIVFAVNFGVLPATGVGSKGSDQFILGGWEQGQIRDPAADHALDGAARHHHALDACGGRRSAGARLRADAARQGPERACGHTPCGAQRAAADP